MNEKETNMGKMTRAEFTALPGVQHVNAEITFDHGPDRAAIHHDIRDTSVRHVLSRYPAFDSIRVDQLIAAQRPSVYSSEFRKAPGGRGA